MFEDILVAAEPAAPAAPGAEWGFERASDLLREPDPGPTNFLIEELIVEGAIAALIGPYKVAKTWTLIELAVAIVTGRDAFGRYRVPNPGPVVLVMEESGRTAFHRRLDSLARGYGLAPDSFDDLHFAANLGVRLNDSEWQERLLEMGALLKPRAFFFDPFVRIKGSTVDENSQREVGPVLDFIRRLRDESSAAVGYVGHSGHTGTHQRGSSDLEGYWESRLVISKGDDGIRTITADHREAESGHTFLCALDFDASARTLRMRAFDDTRADDVADDVAAFLAEHPSATTKEIIEGTHRNGADVRDVLRADERFERVERRSDTNANAHCWSLSRQLVSDRKTNSNELPLTPTPDSSFPIPHTPVGGGGRNALAGGVRSEPETNSIVETVESITERSFP